MPNGTSPLGSETAFDYGKAARKRENAFTPRFLQINKVFNRPAASLIVRALYKTKVTPNQVTVASFLIGLAGAGCFGLATRGSFIAGGLLTQLSSIVDCADGMLARARGTSNDFGAYLDLLLDRVNEYLLITGVVLGQYRFFGREIDLVLGIFALGLYFLLTTQFYLAKNLIRDERRGEAAENRGWLMFLIALFAVINRVDIGIVVLLLISLGGNIGLLFRFFRFGKI
ncbi:MAG: CDP-alcohol phosphatidyltransferase family protein [Candidatus Aminicenantes bacterium]|nr:CDP-alcohol phosphatidyltransferase family protein [Candidatus Aminicenantes bacterium]